jgi:hypothetical protein
MRRHDQRDGVRRPRTSSQRSTRAASGLLPGPLRVPARSWLTTWMSALPAFGHLERSRVLACGPGSNIQTESEARCSLNRRKMSMRSECAEAAPCAQVARSAVAHENERVWRAERRPPLFSKGRADTIGLRFSARHPLILRRAEGPSRRIDEGPPARPGCAPASRQGSRSAL